MGLSRGRGHNNDRSFLFPEHSTCAGMCFDVRNFLGRKTFQSTPSSFTSKLSQTMHTNIPSKAQGILSSSSTRLSRPQQVATVQVSHGSCESTPLCTPASSFEVLHSCPVDIPPRTCSLKYHDKSSNVAPNAAWTRPIPTTTITRNSVCSGHGTHGYSPRREFQPHEVKILTQWYRAHIENPYPTPAERRMLARQCSIPTLDVSRWFSGIRKSSRTRRSRNMPGVYNNS